MEGDNSSQFSLIWTAALERYTTVVGKKLDDPSLPHPSSIPDLLGSVEAQNSSFAHFRENKASLFTALSGICKPISLLGNVAANGASAVFPPSTACFSAVTYLIGAADGVSSSYDAITGLLETLKDVLVRLEVYDRTVVSPELQNKFAEILATLLEIFARSTKIIKGGLGGRVLRFAKNALLGNDQTLQSLVSKLEKLSQSEHRLVGAETLVESKKTGVAINDLSVTLAGASLVVQDSNIKLDQVSVEVQNISSGQDELREAMHQEMNNVMAAIARSKTKDDEQKGHGKEVLRPSVSPHDMYYSIAKKRFPGSGDWIREEPQFEAWLQRENSILWISGNPGCGKSFLAGNIIAYLKEQGPHEVETPSQQTSVAYFFFKDSDPQTRSIHQALRDVAYQIYQNDRTYAEYLDLYCQSADDIKTIQSAWRVLFQKFFLSNDSVRGSAYVILDGLDEASEEDRRAFSELLSDFKNAETGDMQAARLQIVMVGRPHVFNDLVDALEETPPIIHVNRWKNSDDIANYVESAVKKSRAFSRAPQTLREEIIETMVRNAQGMFLWADLMIRELSKHSRPSSIRECLRRAPKGLYEMFRHVLENFSASLPEEQSEDLNTILAWVACAARPLLLGEIDAILRLKSPEGDGVFGLESMLRQQFASFLNVVRDDGLTTADLQVVGDSLLRGFTGEHEDENQKDVQDESNFDSNPLTTEVVFCHASIGDFFRDEKEGKRSAEQSCPAVGVDIVASRVNAFRTCLQLICNKDTFSSPGQSAPSLRDYALGFWDVHLKSAAEHAKTLGGRDREEIGTLLLKVLSDEHHIEEWLVLKNDKFFPTDILHAILEFVENDDFRESLPAETRDWVDAAMANPAELFVPVARLAAVKWLQTPFWNPCFCMTLIYRIITMLKGEPIDQLPECPSAESIISVAEWAGFEKAAEWHRRLAMCLRDCTHFEEAKEHFQIALDLDDQLLSARAGLAIIYSRQKQHEKSLELCKMNLSIMENLLQSGKTGDKDDDPHSVGVEDVVDCFNCIAQESLSMGDKQSALIYSRKAVEMSKEEYSSLSSYLEIVAEDQKTKDNQEIMRMLKSMDVNINDHDHTHLTQCLLEKALEGWVSGFYMTIASAAQSAGEIEWLEKAYETAIIVARKQQKSVIAFSLIATLADLYMAYDNKETSGLHIWKMIIYFPSTFMQGNLRMKLFQMFASKTCGIYLLTAALEAGSDTAEAGRYIEMLENICKHKGQHLEGVDETITDNHVGAFLGRWYYLNGQEAKARPYFLPYFRRAVLADGKIHDPMNEYNIYYAFAHGLLGVGDDANAIAVFHGPHMRMVGWICVGRCGRIGHDWTGISVCRYCTAELCDECAQHLDAGKTLMVNGYCRPNHSRLRIPPAAKIPEPGEVCLGDEIVPWKDFTAPIRRQWGLN